MNFETESRGVPQKQAKKGLLKTNVRSFLSNEFHLENSAKGAFQPINFFQKLNIMISKMAVKIGTPKNSVKLTRPFCENLGLA